MAQTETTTPRREIMRQINERAWSVRNGAYNIHVGVTGKNEPSKAADVAKTPFLEDALAALEQADAFLTEIAAFLGTD